MKRQWCNGQHTNLPNCWYNYENILTPIVQFLPTPIGEYTFQIIGTTKSVRYEQNRGGRPLHFSPSKVEILTVM